jgi:hypothetical protein
VKTPGANSVNSREAIVEAILAKENMITRARDELFSHINRCGVLQAEHDDQQHWMDETIDYLAERYPDLGDGDLKDLYSVRIRFCQPAIPHGRKRFGFDPQEPAPEAEMEAGEEAEIEAGIDAGIDAEIQETEKELVPQEVGGESTTEES